MKVAVALLALPIACSDGQPSAGADAGAGQTNLTPAIASATAQPQSYSCGGTTDLATVERYFADLGEALARPGPLRRFNRFVRSHFGVTPVRGPTLYFHVSDVGSVTPAYITIAEWREIHRRGERSLNGAGYRGCFMDDGKVWFEGSREDGLRLMGIARDMPWLPLAESRSRR